MRSLISPRKWQTLRSGKDWVGCSVTADWRLAGNGRVGDWESMK